MSEEQPQSEPRIKRAWGMIAAWIAGITTVVAFAGTLTGTFSSISEHLHRHKDSDAQIATAQTQVKESEYQQAVATYTAVLKTDPGYKPALDGRLAATEQWAENFHLVQIDGKISTVDNAGLLDQITAVLEEALTRTQGSQKADIQAHLGWAHWLDFHLLAREGTPSAEEDFRAALAIDPNNVYANAMLGNYLLQLHRSPAEASQHFDTALATGKERAYVRRLQIAGLTYLEEPGARSALFRAADAMRKNNEPLPADRKLDARGFCCTPGETTHDELVESFSSVPRDDAWKTYLWLSECCTEDPAVQHVKQLFIQALLTEIAGDRDGALQQFQDLDKQLAGVGTNLDEYVPEEIKRLAPARH